MTARLVLEARSLAAMTKAGVLPVARPDQIAFMARSMRTYGPFGGAVQAAAKRHGDKPAIADERGEITYAELNDKINRLSNALREKYKPGQTVGILCRNHRGPLITAWAASRAGLNTVWLNTAFSTRQATEVTEREGVDVVVCDADLKDRTADLKVPVVTTDISASTDELDELIGGSSPKAPPRPKHPGRLVLLTSGTTGTPKGAPRTEPRGYTLPGSLLDRMPMRSGEVTVIGPPLFHGTGLIMTIISIALGNKVVLRPTFKPEQLLADIVDHQATTVCAVPVMLQRVMALDAETLSVAKAPALRVVFCSGSALPAAVSAKFQDRFGDVIYNLYGSTEVSVATIATPDEVRHHPHSVGKPALGSRVEILDDNGKPLLEGERGRVFVGTVTPFEGYTGGGTKDTIDGMMATGDVGHFEDGRLYVDGRDDDMIVSGGENVFPLEVEELLVQRADVQEAAVVGVEDEEFGARLRAFVAPTEGASLTEDDIKNYVRENLARYKVPRDVIFLGALPRNPTGKVLKRELVNWENNA